MSDVIRRALKRDVDCPEIAQLFEALEQEAADPRRLSAEQHLVSCPACQAEWSLYRQFDQAEVRPDERESVEFVLRKVQANKSALLPPNASAANQRAFWQRFRSPAWLGGAALAMAALILAVGVASQWRARHSSPAVYSDDQALRSQSIEIITPLSDIPQTPSVIQWNAVPGAANYAVTLTEVDGTGIFYTNVTSSSLSLPAAVHNLLEQGKALLLDVTALDASGKIAARSGKVRIRVRSDGAIK